MAVVAALRREFSENELREHRRRQLVDELELGNRREVPVTRIPQAQR
jgi:hypothetical protein